MTISKKLLLFSGLLACLTLSTFAQNQTIIPEEATIIAEEDTLTEEEANRLPVVESFIPTADANEVRDRLMRLQRQMPLTYNPTVHSFVDYFIYKKPSFTKTMLEKKDFYFPIFEKYLAKYNMPDELKYLSLIESGLNPKAISRSKAVGLWQFMKVTAKIDMGLRIDEYVDERMHIEKSTDAACRYLKRLYNAFGDWELALASYNTGPGNVRRAIRRAGNITNYWQLHPYLHRDTRSYVPQFTAILYMMNHADTYGIYPEEKWVYVPTQTVYIDGYLNLEAFSNASGISLDEIQKYNPHIQKDYMPSWSRGLELVLPEDKYALFESNRQMILDSAQKQLLPQVLLASGGSQQREDGVVVIGKNNSVRDTEDMVVEDINDKPVRAEEDVKKIHTVKKKIYKVRRGDALGSIADKFNVHVYDLKSWNRLKSNKIMAGQKLTILIDDENEEPVAVERTIIAEKKKKKEIEKTKPKVYTVKRGDTLWSISQHYGGISIEKIKKLNKLKSNSVKAGQKLKIG
jgi:membrane-bound lytic murein transglycosylase D